MKKTYFPILSSSKLDCSLLQGMFLTCEMISSVIAKLPPLNCLQPEAPDLPFYSCYFAEKRKLSIYLLSQTVTESSPATFYMHLLKKKGIRETSELKRLQHRYCCLTSDRHLMAVCANRKKEQ